ncbi:ribonuclease D [Nocardioides sp.]|uniref:ribonuclease D n=1 Tax=Nocardioides sp. TaxID=35761 RepID=UPI0035293EDD
MTDDPATTDEEQQEPPAPLLELRDGLPDVVETPSALQAVADRLGAATGPVAIDAERASGYRYTNRAYLIQLRREGAGTLLVDPVAVGDLAPLAEALDGTEWILHAATQDLPCLADVGLHPASLFDTELAGRLLGFPRVGLATLVEEVLGFRLRKEHSAVDWSTRPLPTPWLEYAALDVEVLIELRAAMVDQLAAADKQQWAAEEFENLLGFEPAVRAEPWRRTSGAHRVRGRRGQAVVRSLWETRDRIARERDVAPGRLIPDSAIVAAAQAQPTSPQTLLGTSGFHGRGARRYAKQWVAAIDEARRLPEKALPGRAPRPDGPPQPRSWADKDPVAARRLTLAREAVTQLAERRRLPVENLLTPDHLRRVLWAPPGSRDPRVLADRVADQLRGYGARPWQIELTTEALAGAIIDADAQPEPVPDAGDATP